MSTKHNYFDWKSTIINYIDHDLYFSTIYHNNGNYCDVSNFVLRFCNALTEKYIEQKFNFFIADLKKGDNLKNYIFLEKEDDEIIRYFENELRGRFCVFLKNELIDEAGILASKIKCFDSDLKQDKIIRLKEYIKTNFKISFFTKYAENDASYTAENAFNQLLAMLKSCKLKKHLDFYIFDVLDKFETLGLDLSGFTDSLTDNDCENLIRDIIKKTFPFFVDALAKTVKRDIKIS